MAHFVTQGERGFPAGATLAFATIVKLNGAGAVIAAAAATDLALGVVSEAVSIGKTANVRLRNAEGTANVVLGGTVSVGSPLVSNASGAAVAATQAIAGAQPTQQLLGYALEAGVVGDIIEFAPTWTVF